MDARKACAELCEVSELALYLASRGRAARLHHTSLFCWEDDGTPTSAAEAMRERPPPSWGRRREDGVDHRAPQSCTERKPDPPT